MYQSSASDIETVIGKAGLKIAMKEITAPDLSVSMEVSSTSAASEVPSF
jgi:hypothetical protein